jgi:hypothetical protein
MQKNIPKNNSHNKQFALLKPSFNFVQASLGGTMHSKYEELMNMKNL